ncbi:hypothetical protein [Deinococcus sonorensis]|uniref:Uncharacterized protein n=2 Tax=Deinococcus sonorensis TaxID=309891 RepID=A0AAU7UCA9_9DEIO
MPTLEPITELTPFYLAALAALAVCWLVQVARQARQGERPHFTLLTPVALALLAAAPLTEVYALFGMGAALLLIGFYWPYAYRAAPLPQQASVTARPALALTTAGLLLLSPQLAAPSPGLAVTGVSALLLLMGLLLTRLLLPLRRAPSLPAGLNVRFGSSRVPALPDLELHLDQGTARLHNIGPANLYLAGWSPGSVNSWLIPRDDTGHPLQLLPAGSVATLAPWPAHEQGLRVWYVRQDQPDVPLLYSAEWQAPDRPSRVLN